MKIFRILCLLMIVPGMLMALGQVQGAQTGLTTVTIAAKLHPQDVPVDWSLPLGQLVSQRTGVRIEAEYWPDSNVTELSNLRLASGSLPDLMFVTPVQASVYGMEGVFDPLDNLLSRYAPNIMKHITPENAVALKGADGKMYYVTNFIERDTRIVWRTWDYRLDILREMNEPEPTNMDEWYQLFKKVKARYPDMIPLVERSRRIDDYQHTAFGLGMIDEYYGIIGKDYAKREIVYNPITNEWRNMLQWYARLYAEDLLDREYLTIPYDTWWEGKIAGGKAFACFTMNASRADQATELAHRSGLTNVHWWCARNPMVYGTNERVQYTVNNPWDYRGGYALNSKSRVKEAAIRFMDFMFQEEFYNFRSLATNYNGREKSSFANTAEWEKYIGAVGFMYYPMFEPAIPPVLNNSAGVLSAGYDHYFKNNINNVTMFGIPTITKTGDMDKWVGITADLKAYIETSMDEFITGRRSFNQWDAYVAECRRLGVVEGVAKVQEWYDNYWRLYDAR